MSFKVTILLATYNRAHFITETLRSIQNQTYQNWECIIVDDYSEDNTKEVVCDFIKNDNRFSYFIKTEKYSKGLSGSRNLGLDIAESINAQFIQLFDDDDIMHPEKLMRQMDLFKKNNRLDIVNCKYQGFNGEFDLENHIYVGDMNIESNNLPEDFLFKRVRINSLGPVFKASLLRDIRFDKDLSYYAEEEEFYIRLFFLKRPYYDVVNDFLFFYRHHPNSITSRADNIIQKMGTIILVDQKVWTFLSERKLVNKNILAFYIKRFLLDHYNFNYLIKVKLFIENSKSFSVFYKKKNIFIIYSHMLYRKIIYKILH